MQRPIPWFWIAALGVLLVAPGLAGRLFVDVLEGITLLLVFGPLVLAGAGFLAWQWFKRRVVTCPACGTPSVGSALCPACGADLTGVAPAAASAAPSESRASDAVVDVQVSEVRDDD
ncbi:MAG: hypothetical protein FJ053_04975 [Cyanobacteria bacterium M_surface_10_m1_298]|nr:hypothetical protein [Cyanobacteria bacterium M_surface_10_m1_298]